MGPGFQRLPLLGPVLMPVVNGGNSFDGATLMIQHGFDDMRRNFQGGHAAGAGPSKVMQRPRVMRIFGLDLSRDAASIMSLSRLALALEKPLTGVTPVFVKTKPSPRDPRQRLED